MLDDRRNTLLAFAGAGLSLLLLTGAQASPQPASARSKPAAKPTAASSPTNSCKECLERRPILSPDLFSRGFEPEVQASYAAAQKYPGTLDRIHCFCECKESPRERHKTLLTCFTNEHAAGCGICQHEALLAAKLKDQGASDEETELAVESLHKTQGHPPTFGRGL